MDYSEDYRGPLRYSKPDNSTIDCEKYIFPFGWCPFTAGTEQITSDELLAAFISDNTNNILPYQ